MLAADTPAVASLAIRIGQAAVLALTEPDPALAARLEAAGFGAVVVGDAEDLVERSPEIAVITSVELDDSLLATLRQVRPLLTDTVIICVLGPGDSRVEGAAAAGADTIVETGASFDHALELALDAARVGYSLRPRSSHTPRKEGRPLSARERQTLAMVTLGFSNGAIAQKLHISESTVKSHLSSSFAKLGVRTRAEAAARILTDRDIGAGILSMPGQHERLSISRLDGNA